MFVHAQRPTRLCLRRQSSQRWRRGTVCRTVDFRRQWLFAGSRKRYFDAAKTHTGVCDQRFLNCYSSTYSVVICVLVCTNLPCNNHISIFNIFISRVLPAQTSLRAMTRPIYGCWQDDQYYWLILASSLPTYSLGYQYEYIQNDMSWIFILFDSILKTSKEWSVDGDVAVLQVNSASQFQIMMTSSNGNNFRVTGHLCGEFTGTRWIPRTKASDAELWCFPWSASE